MCSCAHFQKTMTSRFPQRLRRSGLMATTALLAALLGGCATTDNAISDAQKLLAEGEARKLKPAENLNEYALALRRAA